MKENKRRAHPLQHFITITKHRHAVIRNCFKAGIGWQGLGHDLSKYSLTEFIPSARFYTGKGSPTEGERQTYGYSAAWMHHQGRNRHHFEYWYDYHPETRKMSPVKMPARYTTEMFCDRIAASKIYMKERYTDASPLGYFEHGKGRYMMHPETARELEALLRVLAVKGEKAAFAAARQYVKTGIAPAAPKENEDE